MGVAAQADCVKLAPGNIFPHASLQLYNAFMETAVRISESGGINSDPVLGPRVRRASQVLQEIIGSTSEAVSAEWVPVSDANGRQLIRLALTDSTGAREEVKFAPDELAHEERLRARLYKTWGNLLQDRSHQQLNHLSGRVDVPGR